MENNNVVHLEVRSRLDPNYVVEFPATTWGKWSAILLLAVAPDCYIIYVEN